jgi:hypothetical protein
MANAPAFTLWQSSRNIRVTSMTTQRPVPAHIDAQRLVDWDYISDPALRHRAHEVYVAWVQERTQDVVWSTAMAGTGSFRATMPSSTCSRTRTCSPAFTRASRNALAPPS